MDGHWVRVETTSTASHIESEVQTDRRDKNKEENAFYKKIVYGGDNSKTTKRALKRMIRKSIV